MYTSFTDWDQGRHLQHYGVLGMKWGMRRYQNEDGSLTPAGERHYQKTGERGYHYHSHATKKYQRKYDKVGAKANKIMSKVKDPNNVDQKTMKKLTKLSEKADKYSKRQIRSSLLDVNEQEYAKGISTGKAIIGALLFGTDRMKGYAQYRGMADLRKPGQGRGKNMTGQKVAAGIKAYRGGSISSRIAKAAYLREGEKPNSIGQKAYKFQNKITDAYADMQDSIVGQRGGWPDREKKRKKA